MTTSEYRPDADDPDCPTFKIGVSPMGTFSVVDVPDSALCECGERRLSPEDWAAHLAQVIRDAGYRETEPEPVEESRLRCGSWHDTHGACDRPYPHPGRPHSRLTGGDAALVNWET